ncbi:hypothetical protein KY285_010006 [Solanum tuberosum]|nr:hypothetical protein KY285_010006 [Solanum tuberosum]
MDFATTSTPPTTCTTYSLEGNHHEAVIKVMANVTSINALQPPPNIEKGSLHTSKEITTIIVFDNGIPVQPSSNANIRTIPTGPYPLLLAGNGDVREVYLPASDHPRNASNADCAGPCVPGTPSQGRTGQCHTRLGDLIWTQTLLQTQLLGIQGPLPLSSMNFLMSQTLQSLPFFPTDPPPPQAMNLSFIPWTPWKPRTSQNPNKNERRK